MTELCVREFGLLIQEKPESESLDFGYIENMNAWSFLEALAYSNDKQNRFIKIARYQGKKALKVVNFVGVITTPDGTQIEILPKTSEDGQDRNASRKLLWKMLGLVENLHFIETTDADLKLQNQRLLEVLISVFLACLSATVRRGIRKDYERIEADELFLRGQLQVSQQLRQPAFRQHRFKIEYDVFSEDRAENRLIHSALIKISKWSKSDKNQQLARELRFTFHEVPESDNYNLDFRKWCSSRDMIYYQSLLPWLKLILNEKSPFTLKDKHAGISFLFPMESLFEKYVAKILEKQLHPEGYLVRSQLQQRHLSEQPKVFLLKPDLAIYKDGELIGILDTKWKLINSYAQYDNGSEDNKAAVAQSDVYQMYAYGHKYLNGSGRLLLIYPKWTAFINPLPQFDLGKGLKLDVVPFNLEAENCSSIASALGLPLK